jgi:hypothetical protein
MKREPLFHRSELVNSRADFERETAADFWQTGASGRRYSRDYVWANCASRTYLLTYALWGQGDRLTRRLTVWQGSAGDGWKTLYHQGTAPINKNDADVNGSSV